MQAVLSAPVSAVKSAALSYPPPWRFAAAGALGPAGRRCPQRLSRPVLAASRHRAERVTPCHTRYSRPVGAVLLFLAATARR